MVKTLPKQGVLFKLALLLSLLFGFVGMDGEPKKIRHYVMKGRKERFEHKMDRSIFCFQNDPNME